MNIRTEALDVAAKYHKLYNKCVTCYDTEKIKHYLAVDTQYHLNGFIWLASLCEVCTKNYSNNCTLIPLSEKEIFYIQINAK